MGTEPKVSIQLLTPRAVSSADEGFTVLDLLTRRVHGKGTGVLRKTVHDELRKNKHVKSFRLGVYGEGETGVTIAELK